MRLAPPALPALAERVIELSDLYTLERELLSTRARRSGHLLARTFYFLCADAPKVHLVLDELRVRHGGDAGDEDGGETGRRGRMTGGGHSTPSHVLDLGCGVGTTAAGVLLSLPANAAPLVITGVDRDEAALEIWQRVAAKCGEIAGIDVEARPVVADVLEASGLGTADGGRVVGPEVHDSGHANTPDSILGVDGSIDLVIAQALLNETLEPPAAPTQDARVPESLRDMIESLARRAPMILIEPALRIATRPLHALRDELIDRGAVGILAPCLHARHCPMLASPRDWCHELRGWQPTSRVHETQRETRRRDDRVKFSFVATHPATRPVRSSRTDRRSDAGASSALAARLVSDAMASKGKVERWLCGDDGVLHRLRLLDRECVPGNAALATARRGAIVELEGLGESPRVGVHVTVRVDRV